MPSTHQSIFIDAPVYKVWEKLSDFHDLSFAPGIISDLEKVGTIDGRHIGAKRILNHAFYETLIEADHKNHVLRYTIDDGPSPVSKEEVSNYIGTVKLSDIDDGTLVEWDSSWESNQDDAVEFCHNIYVSLLKSLSESVKN